MASSRTPKLKPINTVSDDNSQDVFVFPAENQALPGVTEKAPTQIAKKPQKPKTSGPTGLTGREYEVLRIINAHGWCTAETVRQIAGMHGLRWAHSASRSHQLLRRLKALSYVISRKVPGGTRTEMCALTLRGRKYVKSQGDELLCGSDALTDPASPEHFLGLTHIVMKFLHEFPAQFWLTDFEVRSDNAFIGPEGLAKDYDSVMELVLPTGGHVRFAIEYERSQQSASRHATLKAALQTEKRLHYVLFVLEDLQLLNQLFLHLRSLGGLICFVEFDQFLRDGDEAIVYYAVNETMHEAPLCKVMEYRGKIPVQSYTPVNHLKLRFKK